jgi:hypothetical protein
MAALIAILVYLNIGILVACIDAILMRKKYQYCASFEWFLFNDKKNFIMFVLFWPFVLDLVG